MLPRPISNLVVVFDLDDTLCQEFDYMSSAYREIAALIVMRAPLDSYERSSQLISQEMLEWYARKENVFARLLEHYPSSGLQLGHLIRRYREHVPELVMNPGGWELLNWLRDREVSLGVITDGYSLTQRNKLKALNLLEWLDLIVISEEFGSSKPDCRNYQAFECKYPGCRYVYIGDNVSKDFISPNQLGWTTIAIKDRGGNIHSQNCEVGEQYMPQYFVESLAGCVSIIEGMCDPLSQSAAT